MSNEFDFGGEIVWRPTPDYIENSNLYRFMQQHKIQNYNELMQRSTQDIAWFTDAVLRFLDIRFSQPYSQVVDLSSGPVWPRWVPGGKMNIIHNCLDKYMGTAVEDRAAIITETEDGEICTLSYGEIWRRVNQAANALRSLGLKKGDAIGLYMPMTCEIAIAMLAIAKIGGVILPLFSGYGAGAIVTRMVDADAKGLFTADGFFRRGKPVDMKSIADEAAAQIPSLRNMIVFQRTGNGANMTPGRDHWWHELVASQPDTAPTEDTDAEDVLMIIYTSGTTGRPKGAIHTHASFPVKATQDMALNMDLHPGQLMYWMTDMGWMMGPWLVFGALLLGSSFFMYDGAPDYPGPDRVWDMVERHGITHLGISPTLIRSLIPHGEEQARKHDLSSLLLFGSTGEPWNPGPWMWLFEQVGEGKRPIINYSGGTEISGGILCGNPLLPLKPCAFSAPCPGMAADVFDEEGHTVRNQVGELVIKAPWIGMTRGFWKDPKRYEETYWSRWPGVWVHGDFAAIDTDGMWYILGRSDDTIKIAGKRLGPAEVESILVEHPEVVEAAAIAAPDEIKGNELVVFCVLKQDCLPSAALRSNLKERVIQAMGKPLAPREVLFVSDLPKTRNAKVMRRMIRAAYLGQDPGDTSSLVNPESVEEVRKAK